jgi:hypothetical protein
MTPAAQVRSHFTSRKAKLEPFNGKAASDRQLPSNCSTLGEKVMFRIAFFLLAIPLLTAGCMQSDIAPKSGWPASSDYYSESNGGG